ncbi:MAG TPA: tetratricopeptide repeat protein, partial [Planctomycetes bacterium]|nr:tetratricopeptide repeat protein [Planctomycetota bacterium]
KRACELERSNWEVLLGFGTYLLDRGKAARALPYLRKAVQFAPSDAEKRFQCRYQTARALLALGNLSEASKEVEAARNAGFHSPYLDLLQGILLICSGKPGEALDPLGKALQELPDRAEPGLALGIAQGLSGHMEQALATLEAAGERDPLVHPRAQGAQAWFQRKKGALSDALDTARKALQEAPDDPFLLYLSARLQRENGDPEGARVPLSQLLARYQAVPAFLVEFALVEMENQNLRKAQELVDRALEGAGASAPPVWLDLKGDILLLLHRLNEAYDAFLLSKKQNRSPHARIGLAQVAYYKGDIQEALDILQGILNDYPAKSFWAVTAAELRARISYHAQLEQVVDDFQRVRLGAGRWRVLRQTRAVPRIEEGWLVLKGTLDRERTRKPLAVVRENEAPGRFVSVEVDCKILPGNQCDRVGLKVGVARTIGRGFRKELDPEVSVYWDNERGSGVTLVRGNGVTDEKERKPKPIPPGLWKEGEAGRLRVEYGTEPGEGASGRSGIPKVRIYVGDTLVREVQLPGLGRSRGDLEIFLFAEGRPGETVQAAFDTFRLVRKKQGS